MLQFLYNKDYIFRTYICQYIQIYIVLTTFVTIEVIILVHNTKHIDHDAKFFSFMLQNYVKICTYNLFRANELEYEQ